MEERGSRKKEQRWGRGGEDKTLQWDSDLSRIRTGNHSGTKSRAVTCSDPRFTGIAVVPAWRMDLAWLAHLGLVF